jgi:hypothetical protein
VVPDTVKDCGTFKFKGEATSFVEVIRDLKQYQERGYNMYRGWTQIEYQNKHYNINQKNKGT